MNTRRTIRRIAFITMWLVICAGMLTLFIAAMGKQKREHCEGYAIKIMAQREKDFFLSEQEIVRLLKAAAKGNIRGQSKAAFDLQRMERMLEDNVWIRDAQLYFDNKAILHISVEEREPLARIFTAGGRSFYIDENEQALPLSEKAIAKVPVFTGFPDKKILRKEDSVLLHDVNRMAKYISGHPFWSSQVAQIDIVGDCGPGCWDFEMIPVIGRHIVKLGDGENMERKLQRLFAFYEQVLVKTGMDHYKTIDLRFEGQVVAAKSENPRVDSVQLRKNVEELLQQINKVSRAEATAAETTQVQGTETDGMGVNDVNRSGEREQRTPRAVMPRRND